MSEQLANVHAEVNAALLAALKRKSSLMYESPADVDRHDGCIDSVEQDIEALIKIRQILEERLAN